MEVLTLIIVLVLLVLVHEFGHFVVAKWSGMRVDEFGVGYPPRLIGFKYGETEYTLNALPFGGFVRIYGEDLETPRGGKAPARSFASKPRSLQALVLIAGIAMNLLLAFLILTAILAAGAPRELASAEVAQAKDAHLAVAAVLPSSPAAASGLMPGDYILSATYGSQTYTGLTPEGFTAFIAADPGQAIALRVDRAGKVITLTATPTSGIVPSEPKRLALGVGVATVGTVPLPITRAAYYGALTTWEYTKETAVGLWHLFLGIVTFTADFSQVSGPVGIAGAVGSASSAGLGSLLSLVALISINLALINVLPIPALDGGRLLFVIIEAITRRPIRPKVAGTVNTVGFALLVLLMIVVTGHDIYKLVV